MHFCAYLIALLSLVGSADAKNKVIIVAMSGLRYDYVNKGGLNTFQLFKSKGFQAKKMEIPFVTNSWTSLTTIATGLWPEEHGVIDDIMYDPSISTPFTAGLTKPTTDWMPSKPMWITAEEDGVKTAVSGWPGGVLKYGSVRPTHARPYVSRESDEASRRRIEEFASWMYEDADLGLLLLPEPDNSGHEHGPESEAEGAAILRSDRLLGYLLENLRKLRGLDQKCNIIVVGDHGMTNHFSGRVIYLSDYGVHLGHLRWITSNLFTTGMLVPRPEHVDSTYRKLSQVNATIHMNTYLKKNLPDRFHIKNHRRTAPITLVPKLGYRIEITRPHVDYEYTNWMLGMHGYDNSAPTMKPAMLAMGPDFKKSVLDTFHSNEIYPLVCSLLNLRSCHGSDGTLASPRKIVKVALTERRSAKLDYRSLNTGKKRKPNSGSSAEAISAHCLLMMSLYTLIRCC